jgi:uncharacterized protein YeaO (DUF488 family)
MVRLKRAYDPPEPADGTRVLVDRLWPRGKTKAALAIDLWLKDLAPSTGLRQWYGHDEEKWPEFQKRYRAELSVSPAKEALAELKRLVKKGRVTLVYSAKNELINNATLLAKLLRR